MAAENGYQRKNPHESVCRTRSLNVLVSEGLPQSFMQNCQVKCYRLFVLF